MSASLSQRVDLVLKILKWPSAVAAIIFLPGAGIELADRCSSIASKAEHYPAFLSGCAAYIIAWLLWFRSKVWGSAFSTLVHELTHAVFGLLTFRIIRGIKISWSGGGHVRFSGQANWLIYIAPYWFPLLTVALIPVIWVVSSQHIQTALVLLGTSVGFHLCATWRETHPGQTDLKKVGFIFSLCVLPFLNLVAYGSIIAYMLDGFGGVGDFILDIGKQPLDVMKLIG